MLYIINKSSKKILSKSFIQLLRVIEKIEHESLKNINLVFVDNKEIRDLNMKYRQQDCSTDVLSFNYQGLDMNWPHLKGEIYGEIIISVEQAGTQANENKITLMDELNKLFIHGALHLLGYDHQVNDEYENFKKRENNVLENYNIKR